MEILSGKFKGQQIKTISSASYRPTTSRVRKSIFDILGTLDGNIVLDLYAGSGILGFEALSRGASEVHFIDNDFRTCKLLKQNSGKFEGPQITITKKNVFSFLSSEEVFDLIFADPPYGKVDLERLIESCLEHLKEGGKFILETGIRDKLPAGFNREKLYGDTRITFWENRG